MALTSTQKNLLKKQIEQLRCGGIQYEERFNGLIQLFALNITQQYGWSAGFDGITNVFGTWALSYETEQTLTNQLLRFKGEKLKELITYKRCEQGKADTSENRGTILREIATKAAYTLLHQHVFVRIHEMLPEQATLDTPDLDDDWGDFGDLEDWDDLDDWGEEYSESESSLDETFNNQVEQQVDDIRNDDGTIKTEHARNVRTKPLNSAYSGVAYGIRENLGTQWNDNEKNALLLNGYFDEFSIEFPGLFRWDSDLELQYVPRWFNTHDLLIEQLGVPGLFALWADPLTFGWIYQFWNDPYKAVLNKQNHVVGFEIASKTQLFSEQYMVEWLLQNALGRKWMEICQKNEWHAIVESTGTLDTLETKRQAFRSQRTAGNIEPTDLMELDGKLEEYWCYYVHQSIDDTTNSPTSIREVRLLDPACGSGHFLVIALDYLVQLYKEEAKHRGEEGQDQWSNGKIVESILENNLHGLDIDPRAVQIAMCSVYLQGRKLAGGIAPKTFNIGAPDFGIGTLHSGDDPFDELALEIERETNIPAHLLSALLSNLRNAHYIGTLLKVEESIDNVLSQYQEESGRLFVDVAALANTREVMLAQIQTFLTNRVESNDLQTQLRRVQLEKSAKYLALNRSNYYDVVVGNPPYLGMGDVHPNSKLYFTGSSGKNGVPAAYSRAKSDLYACFLERGLELVKENGISGMITMRGWMFIKSYEAFRQNLFTQYRLCVLGDLDRGAFSDISAGPGGVTTVMSVLQRAPRLKEGLCILSKDLSYISGSDITERTHAGLLCQHERYDYNIDRLKGIEGWPLIYWWGDAFLQRYLDAEKLGNITDVKQGMATANNDRFLRYPWEISHITVRLMRFNEELNLEVRNWMPYIKGGAGMAWVEPVTEVLKYDRNMLELYETYKGTPGKNKQYYFKPGTAFTKIGNNFAARAYRFQSIMDTAGSSVFNISREFMTCLMNSKISREILSALNPTVNFQVGDVNRLPLFTIAGADQIYKQLDIAFTEHESHREPSVEFNHPGHSCWTYAQEWAQSAVDRAKGTPLPTYTPRYDTEPDTDHLSYAIGVALGRFKRDGTGIADPQTDNLKYALPHGFLFLDGTISENIFTDGLGTRHPNNPEVRICQNIIDVWTQRGNAISPKYGLREYLRTQFFSKVHLNMYKNKPIHWPLSSSRKTFVVWVNIHRMKHQTFTEIIEVLRKRIEGLTQSITQGIAKKLETTQALEELKEFAETLDRCVKRGPVNNNPRTVKVDALYLPVLDDGVMINSAPLWEVLHPQWKTGTQVPKKWWAALCKDGAKNFDWAHLTKRYFPDRVEGKCTSDPSISVAHGCFWKYHSSRAWQWELRLQDEIGPDFVLEEVGHEGYRASYLSEQPDDSISKVDGEITRRIRNANHNEDTYDVTGITIPFGLWTSNPDDMRQLERKYTTKQGATFTIFAPDRPE